MVHVIKAFLKEDNSNAQEIRRIAVGSDVLSKYELLYEKIKELFPKLKNKAFELGWKDPEGDLVLMSSDDELAQALANAEDGFLKIYVNLLCDEESSDENSHNAPVHDEVHPRAICDVCEKNIQGYRYKCLQCKDYDLCSSCNAANKHPDHDMIKLVRPVFIPREWVFLGARRIWRSMFGCTPRGYHENMGRANRHHKKEKHDDSKTEKAEAWQEEFSKLWKEGFVPVDKIFQNIGNFLKSAGIDVDPETDDETCSETFEEFKKCAPEGKAHCEKNKEEPKDRNAKVTCLETGNASGENELKCDDKDDSKDNQLNESPSNAAIGGLFSVANKKEGIHSPPNINEQVSNAIPTLLKFLKESTCADGWTLLSNEDSCMKTSSPSEPSSSNPKEAAIDSSIEKKKVEDQGTPCDPKIDNALAKMFAMGFTNEGGWLEKLLITKGGNINEALDALYPNTQHH